MTLSLTVFVVVVVCLSLIFGHDALAIVIVIVFVIDASYEVYFVFALEHPTTSLESVQRYSNGQPRDKFSSLGLTGLIRY